MFGITQHISNGDFEDGSGATADYWTGNHRDCNLGGARSGDCVMQVNDGYKFYQDSLSVDSDDVISITSYIRKTNPGDYAAGLKVYLNYSGGSYDSDSCYTYVVDWTSCPYNGQIDAGKTIIAITIEGTQDYTQVDDVTMYSW